MFSKEPIDDKANWKLWLFILSVLGVAVICFAVGVSRLGEDSDLRVVLRTPEPTATPTPPLTPVSTFTATPPPPSPTATPAPPTPTNTRVIPALAYHHTATAQAIEGESAKSNGEAQNALLQIVSQARAKSMVSAQPGQAMSYNGDSRLVLAHYFAWFNGNGWDDCNISAGDKPLEPYHSDDPAAIARHVRIAREVGLNGFTLHWFAPGDPTDRNFSALLAQSQGSDFASTVVFSHHIWHGSPHDIPGALRYIMDRHSVHPNFLRFDGKPVIFFTDVYRTPAGSGLTPQQYWATVRDQVDPQRQTWWIAEGLDPSYLNVFDGLYVFKISHAAYPHDYQKSPRWAGRVRAWEQQTGQPKLWIATISPGWDDLRSGCKPDVRVDNTSHRLDRADGAVYQATFAAALESNPDWLIVASFNEWVEGTYIEPSRQYGDKYMRLTEEFVRQFRDR